MTFQAPPIGVIRTVFSEKFGVPRQSLMISEASGVLKLNPDPTYRAALSHLDEFSHIWVLFVFHENGGDYRATIRPPRLDAPRKIGVFASRSPHRPNPIGLSVVKLDRIDLEAPGGIEIHVSGVDILDGSPVLDIKPYIPYADSVPGATGGWADTEIPRYQVTFSPESLAKIEAASKSEHPRFRELVTQMLEWDPRPTSQRRAMPIVKPESQGSKFGFRVLEYDIKWEIRDQGIYVVDVVKASRSA